MKQTHLDIAYSVEEQPPIRAAGFCVHISGKAQQRQEKVRAFWEALGEDGRLKRLRALDGGRLMGVSMNFKDAGYDYYVCANAPDDLPEGMEEVVVNGGLYASFQSESASTQSVHKAWSDVYNKWFFRSGYGHLGTAELELYGLDENAPCELRIPVKKVTLPKPPRMPFFSTGFFVTTACMLAFVFIASSLGASNSVSIALLGVGLVAGIFLTQYLKKRKERKDADKEDKADE